MTPKSITNRTLAATLIAMPLLACDVESPDALDVAALEHDQPAIDELVDDAQYMREIFVEGEGRKAMPLDLADERQYRFIVNRLRAAGLSPATAPEAFDRLEKARFRAMNDLVPRSGNDRCDMFVTDEDAPEGTLSTIGRSSCVDGSDYSFVQVCHYDDFGNLLDCTFEEEFGGGIEADVFTETFTPMGFADGFSYQLTSGGEEFYYYVKPLTVTGQVTLFMEHPTDVNSSGGTELCLERSTWSPDCDYKHAYSGTCSGNAVCNNLEQPIFPVYNADGSGTYNDSRLYMPLKSNLNAAQPLPGQSQINSAKAWLTLKSSGDTTPAGGLCSADFTGSPYVKLVPFGNFKKLAIDPFALDMGNALWPDHCIDNRVAVDLHVEINVQTGSSARNYVFSSSRNTQQISIAWGCLPPGTPITLADGTELPIERIVPGDQVTTDEEGHVLTVVDVTEGSEKEPLMVIEDSLGHVVRLTATHPVPTLGRGMLEARELSVGDEIETDEGITYVVSVDREAYEGEVFNLVLGTPEELEKLGDQTTMIANHVVVGDARMQGALKVERSAAAQAAREAAPIPSELYVDYVGAQIRSFVRSLEG
ncbi:Hint domain-containing protein [Paraliomyxa miuraensis]|uniref:Hint domain-containing protein n=1 Tax=Paraliomyxa miuraensis TaxID=376150 RepID=UPI0022501C29|nr:Hint domain-containing protein [Paraliomyxa miuraensis]MCX4247676.1 hypothetical protein [Paraliomyxa miuraensis]